MTAKIIDITPYLENKKAMEVFEAAEKVPVPTEEQLLDKAIGYNPKLLEALTIKETEK